MTLLAGFKVVQIGGGPAAAVCGRMLADVGAQVTRIEPDAGAMLMAHLNCGKAIAEDEAARREALANADLIVREEPGSHGPTQLRQNNTSATIITISPFGDTGPQATDPATDLTSFSPAASRAC